MQLRRALALGAAALAAVLFGPSLPATAASAAPALAAATLASTISLSNCSASLVRYPTSVSGDRAMMLTNGHCYEGGFINAGTVLRNVSSTRQGTLLDATGGALGRVRADQVLYATMTGTDVALYRLNTTFAALQSQYGATPLTIAAGRTSAGTSMSIPSGYWKRVWNCAVDGFVPTLREDRWTWRDSIRYNAGCDTIGGTSGSPIVDNATGAVIGVNNTGNESGGRCTLNNPCEVAANGAVTVLQGRGYGQQTYWFTTCLTSSRTIDLTLSGCLLPR
ncbi:S1 family peptidase [Catenuloplanes indicus]|uniref:V8-like Glu-specific endopeptidase n=1 Tax=Catenuloplanes indicus TaxID=137267 RepID=A0AAE3VUF6_9ACTN|nr:serine protease [Catenuloplanes indicus]MDQ0364193.1 V8-like Glu-specific endopeptidase [Catenuloplanes indicus]